MSTKLNWNIDIRSTLNPIRHLHHWLGDICTLEKCISLLFLPIQLHSIIHHKTKMISKDYIKRSNEVKGTTLSSRENYN